MALRGRLASWFLQAVRPGRTRVSRCLLDKPPLRRVLRFWSVSIQGGCALTPRRAMEFGRSDLDGRVEVCSQVVMV